jgi:hypothetical protein
VFGKLFKKSSPREAGTHAQAQFHRCAPSLANPETTAHDSVRNRSVLSVK